MISEPMGEVPVLAPPRPDGGAQAEQSRGAAGQVVGQTSTGLAGE